MAATQTPNDLTRQQLDELDQLLQRMLAMPLSQPEAKSAPVRIAIPSPPDMPPGWRIDTPRLETPAPHLSTEPTPEPVLALSTAAEVESYAMPAPMPLAPVERPQVPAYSLPPEPTPVAVSPVVLDLPMPSFGKINLSDVPPAESMPTPELSSNPLPISLWPLAAMNWMIEKSLNLFGPQGEVLTTRAGKNLLGTFGVVMLLAAAIYTANGQGWVKLPLEKLLP